MPLIQDTIPNIFNGVSQQPPSLRRTSQGEEQINMISSLVRGVVQRPPSQHIAKISDDSLGDVFIHTINRDATEKYTVIIRDGELFVFDMEGTEQTVVYEDDSDLYLATTSASEGFSVVTIKDFTFIVNKEFTPAMLTRSAGTLNDTVQEFSDLPSTSTSGFKYKIEGNQQNNFDSFYVQWTGDVYIEIGDPRLTQVEIDADTMPHELVRTDVGEFTLRKIDYAIRDSGDDKTNPLPSFIGRSIQDIFLHKNRLGFLSGENVIFSEEGGANFFNFFRTTVTTLLDSDPIDILASDSSAVDLRHAVPFADSIILFSDLAQFSFGTDSLLTPTTGKITPTTRFETTNKAAPVVAGKRIYFTIERSSATGVREYFVDIDNTGNDAAEVTKHVPNYIPKNVFKMAASSNEDFLLCLSSDDPNKLYVYQWYWGSGSNSQLQKLQSSWHSWEFQEGSIIKNVDIIDTIIYMVIERDGETFLEQIDFSVENIDTGLDFIVCLDRRVHLEGTYDSGTNLTTWTLPYDQSEDVVLVRDGGFEEEAGLALTVINRPTATTITAVGDWSESDMYAGTEYRKYYEFSKFYLRRGSQDGTTIAVTSGRLQMRRVGIIFERTAHFSVSVTADQRQTYTRTFGYKIGSGSTIIGKLNLQAGTFFVPVQSNGNTVKISIESNSYMPFSILSAEWEAYYHNRAR